MAINNSTRKKIFFKQTARSEKHTKLSICTNCTILGFPTAAVKVDIVLKFLKN